MARGMVMPEIAGQTVWTFEVENGAPLYWHAHSELEARVELALLGIEVGKLLDKVVRHEPV